MSRIGRRVVAEFASSNDATTAISAIDTALGYPKTHAADDPLVVRGANAPAAVTSTHGPAKQNTVRSTYGVVWDASVASVSGEDIPTAPTCAWRAPGLTLSPYLDSGTTRSTIVILGQSNAEGQDPDASPAISLPNNAIPFNFAGSTIGVLRRQTSLRWGVEMAIAKRYIDAGLDAPLILKYAVGGSTLDPAKSGTTGTWDPDEQDGTPAALWTAAKALVALGLADQAPARVDFAIFMQGESDAASGADAASYGTRLERLVQAMHVEWAAAEILIVPLNPIWDDPGIAPQYDLVRAAQESVAAAHAWTTLLSDLSGTSTLEDNHYDGASLEIIGGRLATLMGVPA